MMGLSQGISLLEVFGKNIEHQPVFHFTLLGPFHGVWLVVQPWLNIHIPVTFFSFSAHWPWASLLSFSKVRPYSKASSTRGLNTSRQEAQCPPIKMNSSGCYCFWEGCFKRLETLVLWEGGVETATHWHTKIHSAAWVESFPSSLSEVKGRAVSKAH